MRIGVITLWVILYTLQAHGQSSLQGENLQFDQISLKDGLSQATVLCSWQDHLGFMWFGTRDGLNQYDGYSIKVYRSHLEDSTSIANNVITAIQEDRNGNLWITTEKGLSKFIRSTSKFQNYSLPTIYSGSLELRTLHIDQTGQIWVGGAGGLFLFDEVSNSFIHLAIKNQDEKDLIERPVYTLLEDSITHVLFVGTSRDGVYHIDTESKRIVHQQSEENKPDARVQSIAITPGNDSIWIATYGDGLYLLNREGTVLEHFFAEHPKSNKRITNNNIRALEIDDYGNLWIGTFNGLNILSNKGEIRHIKYREGKKNGLSHGSIRSIFKDNKGSLWIGTYFAGVNILDFDNQRFDHYYNIPGLHSSLSYNVIGAFTEDSKGNLIIGTERGGVNVYDKHLKRHQVFMHQSGDKNSLRGNIIKSLFLSSQGQLWVGVFRGGLNLLNPKTGHVKHFSHSDHPLGKAIINVITEGPDQLLWIGTDRLGRLYCFDPKKEEYINYPLSENLKTILNTASVKHILVDEENELWLATRGAGVIRFDPVNGDIRQYQNFNTETQVIHIDEVNHILKDENGELWISTHGHGIVRFDPVSMKSEHYYHDEGLSSDIVFGSLEDNAERLWFFTLNGLNVLDRRTNTFKNYPYRSGFPIEEINEGAFFKTKSGEFIVGGSNGYVRFNPEKLLDNTFIPPVVFTSLKLSNKEVLPGDDEKVLTRTISKTNHITLDYDQSVVTFEFTALSYLRPENNEYAYMLEGFDDDWNQVGNKRSITFTNLPDGEYTLYVKGSNNDGVWNENPTALTITALPPPWRTWWAYVIYAIVIASGFLIIRYNALKGVQLKHDLRLEQLEKEKLKDIHQLKLEYFTDVSHEFRTPLTLITNPLEEILESDKPGKWMRRRLKIMYLNCKRLLHLIDQILEIRELETGHSRLKMSPVRIESFVGNIIESFKTIADNKHIHLIYSPSHTDAVYLTDTDKIEKIFFNLLSNSFKFTQEGGEILLKFMIKNVDDQDIIHFEVTDNGSGISKEHLDKVFERFYKQSGGGSGAGIGLCLTKSLVDILGGKIEVNSKLNKGTTFMVDIPMEQSTAKAPNIADTEFLKPLPLEYQAILSGHKKQRSKTSEFVDSILLVEDNEELRSYLEDHLSKTYKVFTANNGAVGLEKAKKHAPSLIISDIMMDVMDGMELCKTVKTDAELCHIPVVLLTAKSSHVNRLEGLEIGADDYIHKPFIMREVETRIRNILDNRNKIRDKYRSTSFLPDTSEITFNSYDEKLLRRIVKTIQSNLGESTLTVENLAHEVGQSRVQLFRKLKSLTGLSPVEFIKDFRMKRAAQLLREKNVKVAEVAYEVGFQDVQYFSKCFKKTYGTNPRDFAAGTKEMDELSA